MSWPDSLCHWLPLLPHLVLSQQMQRCNIVYLIVSTSMAYTTSYLYLKYFFVTSLPWLFMKLISYGSSWSWCLYWIMLNITPIGNCSKLSQQHSSAAVIQGANVYSPTIGWIICLPSCKFMAGSLMLLMIRWEHVHVTPWWRMPWWSRYVFYSV